MLEEAARGFVHADRLRRRAATLGHATYRFAPLFHQRLEGRFWIARRLEQRASIVQRASARPRGLDRRRVDARLPLAHRACFDLELLEALDTAAARRGDGDRVVLGAV